eukprot:PLAT7748.2.p1 GENE.PLAT7748.2~~PLAT7748.2.p1  ORF type:complete len:527 (+),score=109.93 PLAT7748.2:271-1851(+)
MQRRETAPLISLVVAAAACGAVPAVMSTEDESKHDTPAVAAGEVARHQSASGALCLPDDVWGVVVSYLTVKHAVSLSSSCKRLRDSVLGAFLSVKLRGDCSSFPAARFRSLEYADVWVDGELAEMLERLLLCPQLRRLSLGLSKWLWEGPRAVASVLSRFSRLRTVSLRDELLTGCMGEALAACKALTDIDLGMRSFRMTDVGPSLVGLRVGGCFPPSRLDNPIFQTAQEDVLRALARCYSLRKLRGLFMSETAAVDAFCAAAASWTGLQELQLDLYDSKELDLTAVLTAVASSCCQLQRLQLKGRGALERKHGEQIGRCAQLRQLQLGERTAALLLVEPFFEQLSALTMLQELTLTNCEADDSGWSAVIACIVKQPLVVLRVGVKQMPASAAASLLHAVCSIRSLKTVRLHGSSRWTREEEDQLGAAFGEAIVQSSVCDWDMQLPMRLLPLLRAWDGRQPAADVKRLNLEECEASYTAADEEIAPLLIRCVDVCGARCAVKVSPFLPEKVATALFTPSDSDDEGM